MHSASESTGFAQQFLHNPDLFPVRFSGERWGEATLRLDFLGGPYQVEGLSDPQVEALHDRFGDLCSDPEATAGSVVRLRVFRVPQSDFRAIEEVGWEYSLDLRYAERRVDLAGLELMAALRWRDRELEAALWTYVPAGEVFAGTLENVFRAIVAYQLAAGGGCLLHSAGVLDSSGGAHLFLGRSGAGKTTISSLSDSSGRQVLSDDLNAVTWEQGQPVVYQMPFSGDFGQAHRVPGAFPLVAVHRLLQGSEETSTPCSPAEGLGILAACATAVGRDPFRSHPLLETLERLAAATPVRNLTFRRHGDPWSILDPQPD